jgi:flagellar hook-associated protein 1 FlgK
MSTLFSALGTAGNALDVLEQAIGVVQGNVSNASTPGYVTQSLDIHTQLSGGLEAGDVNSARSFFSEQSVWSANQQVGMATEQSAQLNSLQSLFSVSGASGIPGALNALYSAFSAWSNQPNSSTAQTQVISAAVGVAQAFNTTQSGIGQLRSQAVRETQNVVSQINSLASDIASINGQIRQGTQESGGIDAQQYNDIEQLSNLTDIAVRKETDGTLTVLMGGQVPLVIGQTQTQIQAGSAPVAGSNANATPHQAIVTASGQDVTSMIGGGKLGGVLDFTNDVIPSLTGDGAQQGSLNQLAQTIADRVNTLLTSGQTSSGQTGSALFSYNAAMPTSVAGTLSVAAGITSSQLAAVDPGPPAVANGIADHLAQLSNPQNAADMIGGASYTDFYSSLASNVGTLASNAAGLKATQTQVLTQAQNMRAQTSGVSLNEQAAALLQFQQGYQASSEALATISNTIKYFMQTMQNVQ